MPETGTGGSASAGKSLHEAVRRLVDAANEVEALTGGEADAVIHPLQSHPLLLGGAQRALARSEAQYRFFLANVPVAVIELDDEGAILYANAAAERILEVPAAELKGMAWHSLPLAWASPSDATTSLTEFANSPGKPIGIAVDGKDGQTRYVRWESARQKLAGLTDGNLVLMGLDETDRHNAIVTAVRLAEAREARSRAEAAARARKEVLSMLSHDLRTPLGASMGYAELLEMGVHGPMTDEQLDVIRRMQGTQNRLLRLIEDLMEFARSETGEIELTPTRGTLGKLVELVRSVLEPEARQLGVELVIEVDDPDVPISIDFERLSQALTNVCSNGLRFSPQGSTVSLALKKAEGELVVEIHDDGPVVAAEHIDDMFSTFWTRGQTGGLGLGLSIASRFIRAHGGELTVDNDGDQPGATFRLRVPELKGGREG